MRVFFTVNRFFSVLYSVPVDIQHNQCPCRFFNFFNPRDRSYVVTSLRTPQRYYTWYNTWMLTAVLQDSTLHHVRRTRYVHDILCYFILFRPIYFLPPYLFTLSPSWSYLRPGGDHTASRLPSAPLPPLRFVPPLFLSREEHNLFLPSSTGVG